MHEGSSQSTRTAQCDRFLDVAGDANSRRRKTDIQFALIEASSS